MVKHILSIISYWPRSKTFSLSLSLSLSLTWSIESEWILPPTPFTGVNERETSTFSLFRLFSPILLIAFSIFVQSIKGNMPDLIWSKPVCFVPPNKHRLEFNCLSQCVDFKLFQQLLTIVCIFVPFRVGANEILFLTNRTAKANTSRQNNTSLHQGLLGSFAIQIYRLLYYILLK